MTECDNLKMGECANYQIITLKNYHINLINAKTA